MFRIRILLGSDQNRLNLCYYIYHCICITIFFVLKKLMLDSLTRNSAKADDPSVPKQLCQMENHLACVNCVRSV